MKQLLQIHLSILCLVTSMTTYAAEAKVDSNAESVPVSVTTGALADYIFHPEHSAPATTLSLNESRISAETSGSLQSLPVLVGQQLKKGNVIAQLDCSDNELRLEKSKATLLSIGARVTLAQRQIKRSASLRKSRNVSEERLNQQQADLKIARADYRSQQAAIKEADLAVSRCKITAPFAGVVAERLVGEGHWLTPGQSIIHLVDNQRLEISAELSSDIAQTLSGAENIKLESNQGTFTLTLSRLVPIIKSSGRNQEARLTFKSMRALPGTTGRLVWQAYEPYIAADIPVQRNKVLGLFLAKQGKAHFHPLPEALEGQPALVQLPAQTKLIIEGRHSLNDGDNIRVTP